MDLYLIENWHVMRALMMALLLVLLFVLVALVRAWQLGNERQELSRAESTDTRLRRLDAGAQP